MREGDLSGGPSCDVPASPANPLSSSPPRAEPWPRSVWAAALILPSAAAATRIFVDWTSATGGSGGGIDATVAATINAGTMLTSSISATNPVYVDEFAASHSLLLYRTPTGPADIISTISFSTVLPAGSRLIIIDVDHAQETATLLTSGTPLTLLAQLESMAGANSIFPSWNPLTGELVATTLSGQLNNGEASIFDLGGLTSIQVDVRGGNNSSTVALAIALPIPEPGTLTLTLVGITGLAIRARRRQTRRCSRRGTARPSVPGRGSVRGYRRIGERW